MFHIIKLFFLFIVSLILNLLFQISIQTSWQELFVMCMNFIFNFYLLKQYWSTAMNRKPKFVCGTKTTDLHFSKFSKSPQKGILFFIVLDDEPFCLVITFYRHFHPQDIQHLVHHTATNMMWAFLLRVITINEILWK